MNQETSILQAITGKATLADTDLQQWETLLDQYPAFGTGHLLFAKKLMEEKSTAASAAQQKAAIHFNDLHWLDYLLKGPAQPVNNQVDLPKPIEVPEPEPDSEVTATPNRTLDTQTITDTPTPEAIPPATMPEVTTDLQEAPEDSEEHPRLSAILSTQLADFQKPIDASTSLPTDAEPLFKTDYFASQGILQVKAQDDLGQKVKRFTDWLKDMKKSESGSTPVLQTTQQEEDQIVHKAAASLHSEVVLTESMAEVLLQQGKTDQAKAVYQKLSLLYPEKSSYFASKIDSLQ